MSKQEAAEPRPVPVVLVEKRHPLALPEGSVRVSLVLLILLPFWLLLALPGGPLEPMPLFLYPLLGLVIVFFASHDQTVTPWHLPWWFFPVVIIGVSGALIAWRFYTDGNLNRLIPADPGKDQSAYAMLQPLPYLVGSLAGGYLFGWVLAHTGDWVHTPTFQDLRAWVSLLAMLLLSVAIIIHLFINPTLDEVLQAPVLEYVVTFLIAWYFGTRA
jgi:hypothetical protein